MTLDALIAKLVAAGAVVTVYGIPHIPWSAELLTEGDRKGLFWVDTFASDQHDAHVMRFARAEPRPDGQAIAFYDETGALVLYMAAASDTPEVSTDAVAEIRAQQANELRDPLALAAWQNFVSVIREDAKNALKISS